MGTPRSHQRTYGVVPWEVKSVGGGCAAASMRCGSSWAGRHLATTASKEAAGTPEPAKWKCELQKLKEQRVRELDESPTILPGTLFALHFHLRKFGGFRTPCGVRAALCGPLHRRRSGGPRREAPGAEARADQSSAPHALSPPATRVRRVRMLSLASEVLLMLLVRHVASPCSSYLLLEAPTNFYICNLKLYSGRLSVSETLVGLRWNFVPRGPSRGPCQSRGASRVAVGL